MNRDLTTGSPRAVLWQFSLPLFGSMVFQQLYNLADSWVAGKFIGENALAAVGNSYEITLIFIAVAFGCNIGCSVIVSQMFGAKEYDNLKTAVSTTMIASAGICAVLMLVGLLFGGALLSLIHTPKEVFADSALYLRIYTAGLPFLFFYNIATGIFSAMGDSKTPFWFLAASSLSNIAVDILFVHGLGMGVDGVAWATFLCQSISCILAIGAVFRRLHAIPATGPLRRFSVRILGQIAVIAVPSILQQSFISVGNIFIQSVINGFGTAVMAGYSAAIKLNNLVITSFTTLGNGVSNFSAQNLGAGRLERVQKGHQAGLQMVWLLCVPCVLLYWLLPTPMIHFFMKSGSAAAVASGVQFLRIVSPFYFVVSAKLVTDGVLRGAGAMKQFMATTFTDLILRVALSALLSEIFGAVGIWSAWPVGWCIATAMSVLFYVQGGWQKNWKE